MDHLIIAYLLLRENRCGCSAPAYRGPSPDWSPAWPYLKFGFMAAFLLIALAASNLFLLVCWALLALWMFFKALKRDYAQRRRRAAQQEVRPPTWKASPPKPNQWLLPFGSYCILQVAALTFIGIVSVMHGEPPPWQGALLLWFGSLVLTAAFKHRELASWWHAWDERGKPIDIEVLPDAKVMRQ
jgi:hypothetical protein